MRIMQGVRQLWAHRQTGRQTDAWTHCAAEEQDASSGVHSMTFSFPLPATSFSFFFVLIYFHAQLYSVDAGALLEWRWQASCRTAGSEQSRNE